MSKNNLKIMKTKIVSLLAILAFACGYSQEKQHIDSQIEIYSQKIDSIIVSEKSKMNVELDGVDKNFKEKKISSDEKQKQRTEIATKYEQIINGKVDDEKGNLEIATKEWVKNSVINSQDPKHKIGIAAYKGKIRFSGKKVKTPEDYLHSVRFSASFVGANLTSKDEPFRFYSKDSDIKTSIYNSVHFSLRYEDQIGGFKSPLFYRLGLGTRTDYYIPKYGQVFSQDEKNLFVQDFTRGTLKKTSLNNTYILIPVELKWVLNPKYVEFENVKYVDNRQTQLYVVAGLYGGVKAGSIIYNKFSNEISNRIVERETVMNGVNNFIFGGKFGIGYGGFNLFIQKDFTPTFNNEALLKKKYGLQIGIEIGSIDF